MKRIHFIDVPFLAPFPTKILLRGLRSIIFCAGSGSENAMEISRSSGAKISFLQLGGLPITDRVRFDARAREELE